MKNQKLLIIGGIVLLIVVVGGFFFFRSRSGSREATDILEESIIPTVDASVEVELEPVRKGEVRLTVSNAPEGTRLIEYEVTYDAQNPGGEEGLIPQGAIGKCSKTSGSSWVCKSTNQENITLGTCSSGTCIYHNVVGKVKVLLKFTGSYGQRIFEKEYSID